MAKYTPTPISTTLSNSAAAQINDNLDRISEALENTLSRNGETPNQATADFDLNNNDLLNVKNLDADTLTIGGVPAQPVDLANALKISNNLSELIPTAGVARDNLGLEIGVDIQAHSDNLDDLSNFVANTIPVQNSTATGYESRTFAEVKDNLGYNFRSIMDFGAFGNDIDFDDAAFTAAANSDYAIYLPRRPFRFSPGFKLTVPIDKFGKVFYADPGVGTEYNNYSAVIKTNTTGADTSGGTGAAAFEFLCSQGKLYNINFLHQGTVKDSSARAVRFDRESTGINTDDIDAYVEGCQFTDYGLGVRQNGRGVSYKNNIGANVGDLFMWSFPATGTAGDPIQSDPILGSRAVTISGNRLHNGNNLIITTGAYAMRGFQIIGNDVDLGDTVANGSFADGEFGNNTCRFSEGAEGAYFITGFGDNLSFNFTNAAGGTLLGAQAGATAIDFVTGAPVTGVTIKGLRARNFLRHAVSFSTSKAVRCIIDGVQGDTLGRDFINFQAGSEDCQIKNCIGYNYGTDGTSRGFLRLTGTHDRLIMTGNNMIPVVGTAVNVVNIATPVINKSYMAYNISTKATLLTGGFTDGGLVQTPNILG